MLLERRELSLRNQNASQVFRKIRENLHCLQVVIMGVWRGVSKRVEDSRRLQATLQEAHP
jgi:hypothetical protein